MLDGVSLPLNDSVYTLGILGPALIPGGLLSALASALLAPISYSIKPGYGWPCSTTQLYGCLLKLSFAEFNGTNYVIGLLQYALPEAVLKLLQHVAMLMRSQWYTPTVPTTLVPGCFPMQLDNSLLPVVIKNAGYDSASDDWEPGYLKDQLPPYEFSHILGSAVERPPCMYSICPKWNQRRCVGKPTGWCPLQWNSLHSLPLFLSSLLEDVLFS